MTTAVEELRNEFKALTDRQIDRIIGAVGRKPSRRIAEETGLHEKTVSDVLNRRHEPAMKTLFILTEKYL